MEELKANKALNPSPPAPLPKREEGRKVKVKIRQNRAIEGVGKAGDIVEMDEALAKWFERDGFVTILEKGE